MNEAENANMRLPDRYMYKRYSIRIKVKASVPFGTFLSSVMFYLIILSIVLILEEIIAFIERIRCHDELEYQADYFRNSECNTVLAS